MKQYILVVILVLFSNYTYSQWQWAKHLYSNNSESPSNSCTDNAGYIYFGGSFTGNLFYTNTDTLAVSGSGDAFITKYDNLGNEIWVKQFGGGTIGCVDVVSIAMDSINSYLYGYFSFCGTATFGTDTFIAFNRDIALVKFDLDGNVIWARNAGGLGEDAGAGITLDSNGNIYFCGVNTEVANFDTISQQPGGFFAKYDTNGGPILVKRISGLNDFNSSAQFVSSNLIYYDNGIYINGHISDDTLMLDTINFSVPNDYGNLLAKFDLDGNIQWAKKFGSPSASTFFMDNDNFGNFYITGEFYSDSSVFQSIVLTNNGQTDGFLIKVNENGVIHWVKQLEALNGGRILGVKIFEDTSLYIIGSFSGSAKFGSATILAQSPNDMFLAKMDSGGYVIGVTTLLNSYAGDLEINPDGQLLIIGSFVQNLQVGSNNFNNMGISDIFIAKHDVITSFEENEKLTADKLIIYANPNAGKCNITIPNEFSNEQWLELNIFDQKGKIIQKQIITIYEETVKVNLKEEAKGIYNVTLSNGKKIYNGKIVFE